MNTQERRRAILNVLEQGKTPISATALAGRFGVSRQVIVGDVALLRAEGTPLIATPRGYVLDKGTSGVSRVVYCRHGEEGMETELNAIVDQGCTVIDVIVEHPIYGQITGPLELSNRYDVSQFLLRSAQTQPLSVLTEGIHLHTLSCPDEAAFTRVQNALRALGVLLEE
jgi:transcriptional regulator of NAD metabolism